MNINANGRGDPSVAAPAATPFGGVAVPMFGSGAMPARPGGISRRVKMVVGGVVLTVIAAAATIAVIRHGEGTSTATEEPGPAAAPSFSPLPDSGSAKAPVAPPLPTAPTPAQIKTSPTPTTAPTTAPAMTAQTKAPTATTPTPTPQVKTPTPTTPPVTTIATTTPTPSTSHTSSHATPHVAPATPSPTRPEPIESASPAPSGRHVDVGALREKATALYEKHQFSAAANVITSASLAGASSEEVRDLRTLAAAFEGVRRTYSVGMSPSAPTLTAYQSLIDASNFDRSAGRELESELQQHLGTLAPKAAFAYFAKQQYENAYSAVRVAERAGSGGSSTTTVRSGLEAAAGNLYREAMAEKDDNPKAFRQKLTRIKGMVDAGSTWATKAAAALSGG
jgi:hypothetical protein